MSEIRYGDINEYPEPLSLQVLGHPVVTPSVWHQPLKLVGVKHICADTVLVSVKEHEHGALRIPDVEIYQLPMLVLVSSKAMI